MSVLGFSKNSTVTEHLPQVGTHTYDLHANPGDLRPHTHLPPRSSLSPGSVTGIVWHQEQASLGLVAVDYHLLLFLSLQVEEAAKGNPPPGPGSQLEAPSLEAVPGDLAFTACQCFADEKKNPLFWEQ